MGNFGVIGMLENGMDIQRTMEWHLQSNHYPPVPSTMAEPCFEAIDHYNAEDYDAEVKLPYGVTFRGKEVAPAWQIIQTFHLEAFLSDFHTSHTDA